MDVWFTDQFNQQQQVRTGVQQTLAIVNYVKTDLKFYDGLLQEGNNPILDTLGSYYKTSWFKIPVSLFGVTVTQTIFDFAEVVKSVESHNPTQDLPSPKNLPLLILGMIHMDRSLGRVARYFIKKLGYEKDKEFYKQLIEVANNNSGGFKQNIQKIYQNISFIYFTSVDDPWDLDELDGINPFKSENPDPVILNFFLFGWNLRRKQNQELQKNLDFWYILNFIKGKKTLYSKLNLIPILCFNLKNEFYDVIDAPTNNITLQDKVKKCVYGIWEDIHSKIYHNIIDNTSQTTTFEDYLNGSYLSNHMIPETNNQKDNKTLYEIYNSEFEDNLNQLEIRDGSRNDEDRNVLRNIAFRMTTNSILNDSLKPPS